MFNLGASKEASNSVLNLLQLVSQYGKGGSCKNHNSQAREDSLFSLMGSILSFPVNRHCSKESLARYLHINTVMSVSVNHCKNLNIFKYGNPNWKQWLVDPLYGSSRDQSRLVCALISLPSIKPVSSFPQICAMNRPLTVSVGLCFLLGESCGAARSWPP